MKMAFFWVRAASIISLMMQATSISETSVNFYQTTGRNTPESSHLHPHRHENYKSHVSQELETLNRLTWLMAREDFIALS
jgi:hypothetical protein